MVLVLICQITDKDQGLFFTMINISFQTLTPNTYLSLMIIIIIYPEVMLYVLCVEWSGLTKVHGFYSQ